MSAAEPLSPALVLSLVLHVAGAAVLGLVIHHAHARPLPRADLGASFAGETFDIDEVLTDPPRRAAAHAEPAKAIAPAAKPEPTSDPPSAAPAAKPKPKAEPKPTPKPAPKAKAESKPESAPAAAPPASSSASAAAVGSSESVASHEGAPAGQIGVTAPTADLAKAFAKAVTAATHRDPYWDGLPLGPVGRARVVVRVDDSGRIDSSELDDEDKVPAALQRLIDRTLLLLRRGRFALSGRERGAGSQTLEIEVRLSQVAAEEDYDDPRHTVTLGFDPPRPGKPGRAYFVHAAGRRFDATISVIQ